MELFMVLFKFVMTALGGGIVLFILYIPFAERIKNPDVLWFIRFGLIGIWIIASFAIGFEDFTK